MKRDLDLVRLILIEAEKADGRLDMSGFVDEGNSMDCLGFHLEMMDDAGLIDADVGHAMGGHVSNAVVKRITWDGFDYLDVIRSDTVWFKVKKAIADTVGETSLSVAKAACAELAKHLVLLKLGIG